MSVTDVQMKKATGGFDKDGNRTYTVVYQVKTNDRADGPIHVLTSSLLPSYLSYYSTSSEYDYAASRQEIDAELVADEESLKLWKVTCKFTTAPLHEGRVDRDRLNNPTTGTDNPLLMPTEISGDFSQLTEVIQTDAAGTLIVNSAKNVIEDVTRDKSYPTLTIKKNFATLNLATLSEYVDAVNSTTFFGLSARKWRLMRASWQRLRAGTWLQWQTGSAIYYPMTYEFAANYDTWDYKPIDRGPWYLVGVNRRRFIDDSDGIALNGLGLLDGVGGKLAGGSTPLLCDGGGAPARPGPYKLYREKDFANLGIPTALTQV